MQCPTCRKPVDASDLKRPGSTFPFCSQRCRDVDLGRWFDERYQIPVADDDEAHDGEPGQMPPPPGREPW